MVGFSAVYRLAKGIPGLPSATLSSRRAWLLVRAGALAVVAFLALVNAAVAILHAKAPTFETSLAPAEMAENGGFAFAAPLNFDVKFPYRLRSDDIVGGSSMILNENGRPLGLPHALHQDIRDLGDGRYSHWHSTVYFSASDNSDPRVNGRAYTVVDPAVLSPFLVRILVAVDVIAGVVLCGGGLYLVLRFAVRHSKRILKTAGTVLLICAAAFLLISPIFQHLAVLLGASGAVLYLGTRLVARIPSWSAAQAGAMLPCRPAHRQDLKPLMALLVCVALYLYVGPAQTYPAPGWADPSIYHGYFTHYSYNVSLNGLTYFSERLAFIVPGIFLFKVLSVEWAYYFLALLPMAVICASLFLIVKDFSGPVLAFGAVALASANALIIGPIGQGYLASIVLAGLFAGFTSLLRSAARNGVAAPSLAAGACFAVAVFTNPIAAFHLPGALGALLIAYPNARSRLIARLIWGTGGGLVVVVCFALANKVMTGSFDFVTPALREAGNAASTQFAMPATRWANHTTRLWYLVIEAVCGLIVLLRCRPDRGMARGPALSALLWAVLSLSSTGIVFIASDFVLKTAYLTYWFYSCYFVIYAAIIGASALTLALPSGLGRRQEAVIAFACAIGGSLAILVCLATKDIAPDNLRLNAITLSGGALSVALLWAALRCGSNRRLLPAAGCVLATTVPLLILDLNPDTRHFFTYRDETFHDAALTAAETDKLIFDSIHDRKPLFWYSRDEYTRQTAQPRDWEFPNNGIYPLWFRRQILFNVLDQIWCNYYTPLLQSMDDSRSIGEAVPDWSPVLSGKRQSAIVVLSGDPEDGSRAIDRARSLFGADLRLRTHGYVAHGRFAVHAWILDVIDAGQRRQVLGGAS